MTHTQERVTPKNEIEQDAHSNAELTDMFRAIITTMATKGDITDLKVELKADIAQIRSEMVTKVELKQAIAESEYRLKDHVSREAAKGRDIDYRQNEKTNEFVRVAQKSGTIS